MNANRVVVLHGLELHEPSAAKPAEHDALRQLRVRSSRRTERRIDGAAVNRDTRVQAWLVSPAERKPMLGKVEDAAVPFELRERTREETRERVGSQMGHGSTMPLRVM